MLTQAFVATADTDAATDAATDADTDADTNADTNDMADAADTGLAGQNAA